MVSSLFHVRKMDCPSEEHLVRAALAGVERIERIDVDLSRREVRVRHAADPDEVRRRLEALGLGATLVATTPALDDAGELPAEEAGTEATTLKLLLAINGALFVTELVVGWVARSTGLLADSLDMFADAAVYGLALYAVGRPASAKLRSARVAGWLQGGLAIAALLEVVRRATMGGEPRSPLMIGMAAVALAANVTCLWLISRQKSGEAHMRASKIFSANDVLANLGVIAAGVLIATTGSRVPDLVIGTIIAAIVLSGSWRILRLR